MADGIHPQPSDLRAGVMFMKTILRLTILASVVAAVLAACGGGSSANSTPTPTVAKGVTTPKAVSVVTVN